MRATPGVAWLVVAGWLAAGSVAAQNLPDYELPPINYSATTTSNQIDAVQRRLAAGDFTLRGADERETLARCLAGLGVPVESQVLVFSKTSLQRKLISPQTPRAIYFSDDCYVGWVPGGLTEIAVTDPQLGLAFYRFDPREDGPLRFERDADCLSCHAGPLTRSWPALLVRSVFPDATGEPISRAGSFVTTQESPLAERWGGWYVTGRHGSMLHMGNGIAREHGATVELDRQAGANLTNLAKLFPTGRYLRPGSDIVALMVLEHQVGMHNRIAEGALRVRKWLHYQASLQRELGEPVSPIPTGTALRVVESEAQRIVEHLLFVGEASLPDGGLQADPEFQAAFSSNRRADSQGRSLKDFDLRTRLFTYPCSYLIYSAAFDSLPPALKAAVYRKLREVLMAEQPAKPFAALPPTKRRAIREILLATKPDLVAAWQAVDVK